MQKPESFFNLQKKIPEKPQDPKVCSTPSADQRNLIEELLSSNQIQQRETQETRQIFLEAIQKLEEKLE